MLEGGRLADKDIKPDIDLDRWLLRAFYDLCTARPQGGAIPITAIWEYADRYGLSELFVMQIQRLDSDYMTRIFDNDRKSKANN